MENALFLVLVGPFFRFNRSVPDWCMCDGTGPAKPFGSPHCWLGGEVKLVEVGEVYALGNGSTF